MILPKTMAWSRHIIKPCELALSRFSVFSHGPYDMSHQNLFSSSQKGSSWEAWCAAVGYESMTAGAGGWVDGKKNIFCGLARFKKQINPCPVSFYSFFTRCPLSSFFGGVTMKKQMTNGYCHINNPSRMAWGKLRTLPLELRFLA